MLRIITLLLLLSLIATPLYAITIFEKLFYKKDVIKVYNAIVLVHPLTRQIKYIWYDVVPAHTNGHWEPVSGTAQMLFQSVYDAQNNIKR